MSSEPYTGPGYSLHVTLHIDPAQLDAFFEAFKPAYDAVTAEPECIFFEMYQDPNVPGKIRLVENWNQSLEWLTSVRVKFAFNAESREKVDPTTPMAAAM